MDSLTTEEKQTFFQNLASNTEMSTEVFQDFLCKMFEKKGILNDLRAYLRGHIVSVLQSAQTGDPIETKRHFAKRLDVMYQAVNILIAEYLLALEFSYTLSVFVSEIPLGNMVFDFAKTLMNNTPDEENPIKFTDNDIWKILKCLGVECSSSQASNMVEMYKAEKELPLLLCMMKCIHLTEMHEDENNSTNSESLEISSSSSASQTAIANARQNIKCTHYKQCQVCQRRFSRMITYYRKKNNELTMILEKLKEAYKKEIDSLKEDENRKLRWSLANNALVLQKKRDQLEEMYKAREAEMQSNLAHKKKFLWGIARALRDQHERMSRAMLAVKAENKRLLEMVRPELTLRGELSKARGNLKKEGLSVRSDIVNQMCQLETKMEALQKERFEIKKQRAELEQLRDKFAKEQENDTKYQELLKKEIADLKQSLQSVKSEQKTRTEVAIMTQVKSYTESAVNNSKSNLNEISEQKGEVEEKCDAASETEGGKCHAEESTSAASSRSGCEELLKLKEENVMLRRLAQQQSERIEELCAAMTAEREGRAGAAQPLPAPHPAPATHRYSTPFDMDLGALDGRNGGGEALCLYANASAARPRLLLPGDNLPFIGVLHDNRHTEARRHIINQWRALRRRFSPPQGLRPRPKWISHSAIDNPPATTPANSCNPDTPGNTQPTFDPVIPEKIQPSNADTPETIHVPDPIIPESVKVPSSTNKDNCSLNIKDQRDSKNVENDTENEKSSYRFGARSTTRSPVGIPSEVRKGKQSPSPAVSPLRIAISREKSPTAVLREAKESLRNQKQVSSPTKREKSPGSVLREAKLRLRKLELEADAVEQSYLDFRKRQREHNEEKPTKIEPAVGEHNSLATQNTINFQVKKFHEGKTLFEFDAKKVFKNNNNELSPRCHPRIEELKATHENNHTGNLNGKSENPNTTEKQNDDYLSKPLSECKTLYFSDKEPAEKVVDAKDDTEKKMETSLQNDDTVQKSLFDLDVTVLSKDMEVVNVSKENVSAEKNRSLPLTDVSFQNNTKEQYQNKTSSFSSIESKEYQEPKVEHESFTPNLEKHIDSTTSQKPDEENFINENDRLEIEEIKPFEPQNEEIKPDQKEVDPKYVCKRKTQDFTDVDSEQVVYAIHVFDDSDDDIAADIDNYYSRLELRDGSHSSLTKLSEDENFWD